MTKELLDKLQLFFKQYGDYVQHHKKAKGFFSDTVHDWQEALYDFYLCNIEDILEKLQKHKGSIGEQSNPDLDNLIYQALLEYICGAKEMLKHEEAITDIRSKYLHLELDHVRSGITAQQKQVKSLLADLKAMVPQVFDSLPPPTCDWLTAEGKMARANILLYVSLKVKQGVQTPNEQEQSTLMMLSAKKISGSNSCLTHFTPVTNATFEAIFEQRTKLSEAKDFYKKYSHRAKL